MKQLWAPWRMAYIDEASQEQGCVFCNKLRAEDARDALVLAQSRHSVVMLNKYPYNNGHLLVAPKRHAGDFSTLPPEEYSDLNEILRSAARVVRQALNPSGLNLGMNVGKYAGAGIEDHLHWHVVPRWEGDTNFMPVVAETRVMPQHLLDSYDRLKPFFNDLGV